MSTSNPQTQPIFSSNYPNPFGITGSNPTFVDIDNDDDLDAFVGEIHGDTLFFKNTGSTNQAAFTTAQTNPFGLTDVGYYADPTLADIDDDGDLDALVGQQNGNILFFKNTGTVNLPSFAAAKKNPFGLANVGFSANPTFADIDDDGDLDAFAGEWGGYTLFFENNGTVNQPSFAPAQTNPFGLTNVRADANPTFADIDGDGDLDAFVSDDYFYADIVFFENTGTPNQPAFASTQENPFDLHVENLAFADIDGDEDLDAFSGTVFLENIGTISTPAFIPPLHNPFELSNVSALVDIDTDGDLDVFSGTSFFENIGTTQNSIFATAKTNLFGSIDVKKYTRPTFADINADSRLDVFFGGKSGNTLFFENISTTNQLIFAHPQTNPFGLTNAGFSAKPTFVDIDGDADFDAFVGSRYGDVFFFKNNGTANKPEFTALKTDPFNLSDGYYLSNPVFADIDGDNDFDAFITRNDYFGSQSTLFFENTGTSSQPFFIQKANPLNTSGSPVFGDIDADHDLDAFVNDIFFQNETAIKGTDEADNFSGTAAMDIFNGLGGNDHIKTKGGNDIIEGGKGADTLEGEAGKDVLWGGLGKDVIWGGYGDDTETGGAGGDVLAANSGNNRLDGGDGNDRLMCGGGQNILTGGAGMDKFRFTAATESRITDFTPVDDSIRLQNDKLFSRLTTGILNANNFHVGTEAGDKNDYLIYTKSSGELLYDADGTEATEAVRIALIGADLNLTNVDFVVV